MQRVSRSGRRGIGLREVSDRGARRPRTVVVLACLGAATVTCAVQGLAPALPAMQHALRLSDAQVALLTTAYLLPSVILGIPAGTLTQRTGRRVMFAGSLSVFGLGGLVQIVVHTLPAILAVRVVQGACFGAILALTITMIGDVLRDNAAQASGQGFRVVAMTGGEALFPILTGLLVGVTWYAPFGIQLICLLIGIIGWFAIPPDRPGRARAPTMRWHHVRAAMADPAILALQLLAFMRFFFKFAMITYYPILAVNERGLSAATVGIVMGLSSLLGSLGALLAGGVVRRVAPSRVIGVCVAVIGLSLLTVATVPTSSALVGGLLVYGVADGIYSVSHNVLVTQTDSIGGRAVFVAFTGTVRNLGKLVAPVAFGLVTLVLPLAGVFAVWGAIGLAVAFSAAHLRPLDTPGTDRD
ncbi:MAG: MFS transporter [Streptosporangiales bacterium]|nr:MFS transporter [Streptosporangiales bacterium]